MTRKQKAIEIILKAMGEHWIASSEEDAQEFTNALLASDFCSDSVAELVNYLYRRSDVNWSNNERMPKQMQELLREIANSTGDESTASSK